MNVLREKLFINEDPNSVPPSIEAAGEVTIEIELGYLSTSHGIIFTNFLK
jgi:hypothetical protein